MRVQFVLLWNAHIISDFQWILKNDRPNNNDNGDDNSRMAHKAVVGAEPAPYADALSRRDRLFRFLNGDTNL
jgi:hypothetical protein